MKNTEEILKQLGEDERKLLAEIIQKIAEEEKIPEDHVRITVSDIVPIRLQHLFRELGKEGFIVKETLILNGKLFILAVKKAASLDIAPDYEYKDVLPKRK